MRFFGEIAKLQEQDDGTIKVYGIASTGSVDGAGETILPSAIKAALPDYMKFGAVRSMHQPIAAGTAIEAFVNDDGEFEFGAHIVDEEAVKKVKAGVYKGFSVGGKCTARDPLNKSIITGMTLIEVSLVDRPANPEAIINVWKADMPTTNMDQTTSEAAPTADAAADPIKKGMYSVSRLADLLSSIGSLATDAEWEAQYEKDNSPVPQRLRDWLAQGAEVMQEMAEEEVAELMAVLQAQVTAKAAATGDIAKAGAKFSRSAKAALSDVHKMLKTCDEAMSKLGYADAEEETEKSSGAEDNDIEKVSIVDETISKAELNDAIEKALAPVRNELDIAKADLSKSQSRVAELEAQPAPAKASLTVVEKSAAPKEDEVEAIRKADGSVDETATAIKKAFASGGFRVSI